nr:MAG TPA_asm: hypothetical protein [Caudoviricetes sp.]
MLGFFIAPNQRHARRTQTTKPYRNKPRRNTVISGGFFVGGLSGQRGLSL